MRLELQPGALTGTLWPKQPVIKSSGLVVDIGLSEPTATTRRQFTAAVFSPTEDHVFCFADSSGAVFHVALLKNKYTLVARAGQPVSALAFVSTQKGVIAIAAGMGVVLVSVEHGKQLAKLKGPHHNRVLGIASPATLRGVLASVSSDTLAFWDTHAAKCRAVVSGRFLAVSACGDDAYTLESGSIVRSWSLAKREEKQRVALKGHRLRSIAASPDFVVACTDTTAVVVLTASTLTPMWVTSVHGESHSVHVAHCGSGLFSVVTADGLASFLAIGKPDQASIATLRGGDGDAAAVSGSSPNIVVGQSLELCLPARHIPVAVASSKMHYAAVLSQSVLQLYHLPTAKVAHDGIIAAQQSTDSGRRVVRPFVAVGGAEKPDDEDGDSAARADDAERSESRGAAQAPADETVQRGWVKVNLLQSAARNDRSGSAPLFASDAVKQKYATIAGQSQASGDASTGKENASGSAQTARTPSSAKSRPTAAGSTSQRRGAPSATPGASTIRRPGGSSQYDDMSAISIDSLINLRELQDEHARGVNLEKLRGLLMRFGVFPEKFRTYIWRFLLGYGDKEATAPRFATLASRGVHPGVPSLLKPFPLPDNRLRNAFEKALSCLAHHAPVFSVAHFVPSIVFPFVNVFHSDVQSSTEAVIGFVANWGSEFFRYYPHMPVSLTSLITHVLKVEDDELLQHFAQVGVGPEVFVWDVVSALYSEVLTRNEWLQVMDHAFVNEPLWLWMFHVRWLVQMKPHFMTISDPVNLASMFRRATPFDINATLQQTYRLHGRCPRNELSAPYERFLAAPRGDYLAPRDVHESVVTSRLEELKQLETHEDQVKGLYERTRVIEKQLVDAAMVEDAFVGRQRALVAAKHEGSSAVWAQRVALEQERNRLRDIEHEARLKAVHSQLAAAERLEQVQEDLSTAATATKQHELDREQETMKWRFADRMATLEVERLEASAQSRLAGMMRGVGPAAAVDGHAESGPRPPSPRDRMAAALAADGAEDATALRAAASTARAAAQMSGANLAGTPEVSIGASSQAAVVGGSAPPSMAARSLQQSHQSVPGAVASSNSSNTASSVPVPATGGPPIPSPRPSPVEQRYDTPSTDTGSRRGQALYDPMSDPRPVNAAASTSSSPNAHVPRNVEARLVDSSDDEGPHTRRTPTQAGKPPAAPGTSSSSPSSAARDASNPQHGSSAERGSSSSAPHTTTGSSTDVTWTDPTTTSSGQITTDGDVGAHFHQLHVEIRQRVEQAQREQRSALAALRSRYARGAEAALDGHADGAAPAAAGDVSGVSDETSVTELHVDDDLSDATTRSSVAEALMRRHDPKVFAFRRDDA